MRFVWKPCISLWISIISIHYFCSRWAWRRRRNYSVDGPETGTVSRSLQHIWWVPWKCLLSTAYFLWETLICFFSVEHFSKHFFFFFSRPRSHLGNRLWCVTKQARFWCNCYHGLGLFWMKSYQSCGGAHPCRALAETEFLPYLIVISQ